MRYLLILSLLGFSGCSRNGTIGADSATEDLYVVIEAHPSYITIDKGFEYHPARYKIRHKNVVIEAECYVLIRREYSKADTYDKCQGAPDPYVPVGKPVHMVRHPTMFSYLDWIPDDFRDGVSFTVLSEKVQP